MLTAKFLILQKKGEFINLMSDDMMAKLIDDITALGIDEDKATEILGIFIDEVGSFID